MTQQGGAALSPAARRRKARLRRTIIVGGGLVLLLASIGYAVGRDSGPADAADVRAPAPRASAKTSVAAPSTKPASTPKPSPANDINAPVTGTTNLEPEMTAAWNRAEQAARADGVHVEIYAGWRSAEWQQVLFDRAVKKYGSKEAASRWVLPPDKSSHVKGIAVDVRPQAGAQWLERHGGDFGLCRMYDNEWWHFELVAEKPCPARRPSATS